MSDANVFSPATTPVFNPAPVRGHRKVYVPATAEPPPPPPPVTVGTRIHEPNSVIDGDAAVVEMPSPGARKFEWVKYAEAHDVPVDGLTKNQIVALFI